jgi:putative ABC transport system substrate-binding protein
MIRRSVLYVALTVMMLTASSADAQLSRKIAKIGILFPGSPAAYSQRLEAFLRGMKDLGYVDGKTVSFEWRWVGDRTDRIPDLAAELVNLNPNIIVANGTPAIKALKERTQSIPILMAVAGDPVGTGLVQSLARPGGNITGLSIVAPNLSGKRLELLREIAPAASVAALVNPNNLVYRNELQETQDAARSAGVELYTMETADAKSLEEAFAAIKRRGIRALIVLTNPFFFNMRSRILEEATKLRLPVMYFGSEFTDVGGLMSYGPNMNELFRRAATYVDKILKGAKPADLPVEQPTKFELVINLKAAKQIGLAIPPNVLARADRVIK